MADSSHVMSIQYVLSKDLPLNQIYRETEA